ncbi:MAG: alpha-amylase family glycosyl hydrolase, partial [Bacteroidota bacterium]
DVVDYYNIHEDYGNLADFKALVKAAHKRNIKVILDLVVNHTSDQHFWFNESVKGNDNPYRDFYIWADKDTIISEGETKEITGDSDNIYLWNEAENNEEKYFGFFWKGMPDLNFDEPKVREEIFKIGRYWLNEIGVDGFRLDAAKHIYPDKRINDSVKWWIAFRNEMEKAKPDVFLVGEVWDEAQVIAPFLKGLHAIFNFDLCFSLQKTLKSEDKTGFIENLIHTRNAYKKTQSDFVDATFTTNHDQDRILSVLEENTDKGKLAAAILLTLPGAPFIYYGEELGMLGRKPDEYIREPFLWSSIDKEGNTDWIEPKYNTLQKINSLDLQKEDQASMYHHYKRLIQLRNTYQALHLGELKLLPFKSKKILGYYRLLAEEKILVIHNLGSKPKQIPNKLLRGQNLFITHGKQIKEHALAPYSTVILLEKQ